jgi:hypothetical protein
MKLILKSGTVAAFLLFFATGAFAQTRTWVSGVGDDANPCSRTAPCKTFAGAISKTAAGGEIDALDDGGFGQVTITKPITIDGGGHLAGILAAGVNGIVINVTPTGTHDTVTIRRLQINGAGTGLDGIKVVTNGADFVHIEDVEIFGFTSAAVSVEVGAKVEITNTKMTNNATGLFMSLGQAVVSACTLTGNTLYGIDVQGSGPFAMVSNSNISFNGTGLHVDGPAALIRISHNDIIENISNAWNINPPGQIQTYRDNRVAGNAGINPLTDVP